MVKHICLCNFAIHDLVSRVYYTQLYFTIYGGVPWLSGRLEIKGLLVQALQSVVSLRNTPYPLLGTGSTQEDRKSSQHVLTGM